MLQEALSKSFHKISDTIHIQMLLKEHQKDAIRLYTLFKKTMEEDTKVAKEYTEDFILKNNMFGIFVDNDRMFYVGILVVIVVIFIYVIFTLLDD